MALRDKLRQVVGVKDSPRKIAISFGIGVFIGMSPVLGLHTVLGILVAWIFRLNKFVTLVGVYITNPWTIVPIYTGATWLGARMLGIQHILPEIDWHNLGLVELVRDLEPILPPFVVGTFFVGLVSGLLGYVVIYHSVVRQRRMGKNG
ncbi:MAG TPA: DUF2062 domain-containing protein [Dissulfurispiraceae bacterium]|nr:DUF2062 domain-containing protein [Dissulfurispiraceae bacterium]